MLVAEKFVSINGESKKAGQLAVFIRFKGCNLHCSYCDTMWANDKACPAEDMSPYEIYDYILSTGVSNVTLTGGEPLLQKDMDKLLEVLSSDGSLYVEIETNGSIDIRPYKKNNVSMTMDYKSPSSGMCEKMLMQNYNYIDNKDTVKFVCGSNEDLLKALEIINKYKLTEKCGVYISPVFGRIEPKDIVVFMTENNMNGVNLQLQLHKLIWDADMKGV